MVVYMVNDNAAFRHGLASGGALQYVKSHYQGGVPAQPLSGERPAPLSAPLFNIANAKLNWEASPAFPFIEYNFPASLPQIVIEIVFKRRQALVLSGELVQTVQNGNTTYHVVAISVKGKVARKI